MSSETLPQGDSTNFLAAKPDAPADRRRPFAIRGHHLEIFSHVLLGRPDGYRPAPAESARLNASAYRRQQLSAQSNPADPNADYWADLIGTSLLQRQLHQRREAGILKAFGSLPDDYPIKLCAVQDAICRACIVGDHCTTSTDKYSAAGPTRIARDSRLVKQFIGAAAELGFAEQVIVTEEMSDYKDMPPQPVPAALTTAEVLRQVMVKTYDNGRFRY